VKFLDIKIKTEYKCFLAKQSKILLIDFDSLNQQLKCSVFQKAIGNICINFILQKPLLLHQLLRMKTKLQNNKALQIAIGSSVILFLIQFLPYCLRSDVYIRIHDTLEGEWIWFSTLVDLKMAMDYNMNTIAETFLGGLPRYLFPSGLSFTVLFIYLFGTVGGYLVSAFVVHLAGFLGCYFLLKQYVFLDKSERHWPILIAALFSIIPFFITFGISVSGQPLLLLAFLNILNRKTRIWEYGFIILFPFYSTIIWSAAFVNLLVVAVAIYAYKKEFNLIGFIMMLGLMNLLYLAINYHLIYATFISDVVLHRDEYSPTLNEVPGILKSIGETFYIFFIGSFHVGTFVTLPIFILGLINFQNKKVKYLLISAFLIALLNGFYLYLVPILEDIHPFIISFNIKRVKILLPIIWLGILAFSIKDLIQYKKGIQLSYFILFCLIVSTLFANDEIVHNYRNMLGFQRKPDAKAFFAEDTFQEIDKFIGKNKQSYRVAHLGLNPTISQHNGFRTIDGLQAMYPLEHKKLMIDVMQGELDKDFQLVRYFNAWGNRCYLFSSELGKENKAFMIGKNQTREVKNWAINANLLQENEVDYIFSTVTIGNAEALGLQLESTFENENDFWRIYLYSIQ
jgi:hypothetical protein